MLYFLSTLCFTFCLHQIRPRQTLSDVSPVWNCISSLITEQQAWKIWSEQSSESLQWYTKSTHITLSVLVLVCTVVRCLCVCVCVQSLAIVMDSFTDVELLCDLLEASRKRNVSVYLLLDHLNLNLFVTMWQELKLNGEHFPVSLFIFVFNQHLCLKVTLCLSAGKTWVKPTHWWNDLHHWCPTFMVCTL